MQKICRTCRRVFGASEQFCPDHQGYLVLHSLVGDLLLGRYRVTEVVGAGLDALVCRGVDEQLGYKVAVKALLLDPDGYRYVVNRFLREAETYAALSDPRFPRVFARNMLQDGRPYFVFEWVDGESLEDTLGKEGRLIAPQAVRLAMEVAAGLQQAHALGFVHLDVTPGNILRYQDATRTEHIKIIDFGIVRLTPAADGPSQRFRRPLGNPPYMSPEQWRRQELDPRTDVWSLGVTLYELLSGRLPFGDDDWEAVRRRVLHDPPPPLRSRVPEDGIPVHIPDALEELVMSMIDKDPDRRPRSMLDVHLALRSLLKELEPDALPYARFLRCFDEPLLDVGAPGAANDDGADGLALDAGSGAEPRGPADTWLDAPPLVPASDTETDLPAALPEAVHYRAHDTTESPAWGWPPPDVDGPTDPRGTSLDQDAILEIRSLSDAPPPLPPDGEPDDAEELDDFEAATFDCDAGDLTPAGPWAGDDSEAAGANHEASFTPPQAEPRMADVARSSLDVAWALASGPLAAWPERPGGDDLHERDTDPGPVADPDDGLAAPPPGPAPTLRSISVPADDCSQVVSADPPPRTRDADRNGGRWSDRQLGAAVVASFVGVGAAILIVLSGTGPLPVPGSAPLVAAGVAPSRPAAPRAPSGGTVVLGHAPLDRRTEAAAEPTPSPRRAPAVEAVAVALADVSPRLPPAAAGPGGASPAPTRARSGATASGGRSAHPAGAPKAPARASTGRTERKAAAVAVRRPAASATTEFRPAPGVSDRYFPTF